MNETLCRKPLWRPQTNSLCKRRAGVALLTLGVLSTANFCAQPVQARNARHQKLTGAWAWTSGSQTYLRARPAVETPAVAKVPRATKLFVWGKYEGWYRVETTDHIFGWIHHEYLNVPQAEKLETLSHQKAKIASDRAANQTMYGTPAQLKQYYARYGASGALRGLSKLGVSLATKPQPAPHKPRIIAAPKPVSKPVAVAAFVPVRPAVVPVAPVRTVAITPAAPRQLAPAPPALAVSVEKPFQPVGSSRAAITPNFETGKRAPGVSNAMVAMTQPMPVPATLAPVSSSAEGITYGQASASAPLFSAAPPVLKPIVQNAAPPTTAPVSAVAANVVPANQTPLPVFIYRPELAFTPAPKPATRSAAKPQVKSQPKSNRSRPATLASRRVNKPAIQPQARPQLKPISPEELIQAREAFLSSRRKYAPTPPAEPGAQRSSANSTKPSLRFGSVNLAPVMNALTTSTLATPTATPNAAAKGRGGSPRDYARRAQQAAGDNAFGQGLATQALSYRGMPYIRGAASPSRGFDCSGLVYYLLRRRGLNPPRTAAGLSRYGKPVAKKDIQPGDMVFFANTYKRGVSHIGVYMGNGKFVHAATSGTGVRVDSLNSAYYVRKYHGARRVQ